MTGYTPILFIIHPANTFDIIYSFTLLVGIIAMIIAGLRQKFPLSQWVAIVASITVLFMIGLKISAYSFNEWAEILFGNEHKARYIKYIPGGVLLVAIAIPLIKRFLKFRPSVFDGLVLFLPLLGVSQRFGCLLNGCCHGTPTDLPWAIHYAYPSSVFFNHLDHGLLPYGQLYAHGVHPTQVYTIIGSLVIAFVLFKTRKRFKAQGSRTLLAVILLAALRFFMEFLREPTAGTLSASSWLFLNYLQWSILVVCAGALFLIFRKERFFKPVPTTISSPAEYPARSALVLLGLVFLVWQCGEILERVELILIYPLLFASMIVVAFRAFQQMTAPALRYITLAMLLGAFLTMGQAIIENEPDTNSTPNRGWWSIGPTGGAGSYEEVSRNCQGNITDRTRRDYHQFGLSANYHYKPSPNHHLSIGIRQFTLTDRALNPDFTDYKYIHFNPYFSYFTRYAGMSLGVDYSSFNRALGLEEAGSINASPSLGFYLGPRDILFAELDVANYYHLMGPAAFVQFGLGSGFGQVDGSIARIGLSSSLDDNDQIGVYFGGDWLIKQRATLNTYVNISKYPGFSIGLQWHLGDKRWQARSIKRE